MGHAWFMKMASYQKGGVVEFLVMFHETRQTGEAVPLVTWHYYQQQTRLIVSPFVLRPRSLRLLHVPLAYSPPSPSRIQIVQILPVRQIYH